MIATLIFLIVLCIAFILIIYNLLNKVEKYEDDIMLKDEYITKIKSMSEQAYKKIVELDNAQAFESDDEVGFFFRNLKDIVMVIDSYLKNYSK